MHGLRKRCSRGSTGFTNKPQGQGMKTRPTVEIVGEKVEIQFCPRVFSLRMHSLEWQPFSLKIYDKRSFRSHPFTISDTFEFLSSRCQASTQPWTPGSEVRVEDSLQKFLPIFYSWNMV